MDSFTRGAMVTGSIVAIALGAVLITAALQTTEAHRLGTERVAACAEAGGTWIQNDEGQSCTL